MDDRPPGRTQQRRQPGYSWALKMAAAPAYGVVLLARIGIKEVPKRTRIGKVLLVLEALILAAGIAALSPIIAMWMVAAGLVAVVAFAARVTMKTAEWGDEIIDKSVRAAGGWMAPHLIRFAEWYETAAYKEEDNDGMEA